MNRLERAWEFHTGDLPDGDTAGRNHSFQATPVLVHDALVFCTPRSRVVAVDAETGELRWSHDPGVDVPRAPYNLNCRGVAVWFDRSAPLRARCRRRVFVATADARLVALDAASGEPIWQLDGRHPSW